MEYIDGRKGEHNIQRDGRNRKNGFRRGKTEGGAFPAVGSVSGERRKNQCRNRGTEPGIGRRHRARLTDVSGRGSGYREIHAAPAGMPEAVGCGKESAVYFGRGVFEADQDKG